jgi:FkbM family methyltransferase
LLDVGARGGLDAIPIFRPLKRLKNRLIHGIEPDTKEAERLRKSGEYDHVFTDGVAWYDGEAMLHVPGNDNVGCASIRTINTPIAKRWGLLERGQYCTSTPIKVKKLSSILPTGATYDFIKVDIEGCDYDALASAEPILLQKALFVMVETQGIQLYEGQTVFLDFNAYMEKRGFFLYSLKTQASAFRLYDAVWLKDPHLIDDVTSVLKYCLLGVLFRKKAFIFRILETYERNNGKQEALESVYTKLNIKRSTCS